jgi:type II secretory pathway pseudopilin PulG
MHEALTRRRTRLAALGRDQSGMTIVELLVTAILLVLGALAIFQALEAASRNGYRSEQRQVALDRAQRELEAIRSLPYKEVAMTAVPTASADQNDPRSRVSGTTFDLNRSGGAPAQMVVNGGALDTGGTVTGGVVAPGPEHFTSGDVGGNIYRFVVWRDDPSCPAALCPGTQDLKRVVVAVLLDKVAISGQHPYVEIASDFYNPDRSDLSNPGPPNPGKGGKTTVQQFWLSDTPCSSGSTSPARVAPTADHLLHNTLGDCSAGLQNGGTAGAPDALLPLAPPDTGALTYDYSSDAYLEPTPAYADRGVQILRQDANGCSYAPQGATPEAKIHRWVSRPVPVAFTMTGTATLEVFSKTINNARHRGRMCAYAFVRGLVGGQIVDTPVVNLSTLQPYFTYSPPGNSDWPRNKWDKISMTMRFDPRTLSVGDRIGVAISVDRSDTPGDALQFLYDHSQFPSRFEVGTTTPIGNG